MAVDDGAARGRRSTTSNMTSAAALARAASSIRRIFWSRSRRASSAARSNGSRTGASISWRSRIRARPSASSRSRSTAMARSSACAATSGVDIGAYVRPNGMTPVRNVAQFTTGPYRVPQSSTSTRMRWSSNKTPSGTYRGPGRFEGCFFMERLLDMAAQRSRSRPARDPPAQSDCARRDALSAGDVRAERRLRRDRLRQRRLLKPRSIAASPRRAGTEKIELAGQADRRPLSWGWHRLLHRRRRLRSERERAHGGRARRHDLGLCRVVGGRAGDRDHHGADRGRCARGAARARQGVSRLDDLSARGCRLLRLALDRDGRLRDRAGRRRAARQIPCGRGASGLASRPTR